MAKFKNLNIGDMFNTKSGRYVKISDDKAMVVMVGMHKLGAKFKFSPDADVIALYRASVPKIKKKNPRINWDVFEGSSHARDGLVEFAEGYVKTFADWLDWYYTNPETQEEIDDWESGDCNFRQCWDEIQKIKKSKIGIRQARKLALVGYEKVR